MSSGINFRCVHCGAALGGDAGLAGQNDVCPSCGKEVTVPLAPPPRPVYRRPGMTPAPQINRQPADGPQQGRSKRRRPLIAAASLLAFLLVLAVAFLLAGTRGCSGRGLGFGGPGEGGGTGGGKGEGAGSGNGAAKEPAARGRAGFHDESNREKASAGGTDQDKEKTVRASAEFSIPNKPMILLQMPAETNDGASAVGEESNAVAAGGGGGGLGLSLGTGDLSFRAYWKPPRNDIDLHVIDPNGHELYYQKRYCDCGGELDRDDTTSGGPENIFWPTGKAPSGTFTYFAVYFAGAGTENVTFEIRQHGKVVKTHTAVVKKKDDVTEHFVWEQAGRDR